MGKVLIAIIVTFMLAACGARGCSGYIHERKVYVQRQHRSHVKRIHAHRQSHAKRTTDHRSRRR